MGRLDALYKAAIAGDVDAIAKLEIEADRVYENGKTILHEATHNGNTEIVRFIVEKIANKKNLWVRLDELDQTALHYATYYQHSDALEVLIDGARQAFQANDDPHKLVSSFPANDNPPKLPISSFQAFLRQRNNHVLATALSFAVDNGDIRNVKMLVEADPTDKHTLNDKGKSPLYTAVEKGYYDIAKVICTTCTAPSLDGPGGSTALHVAIENYHQAKEEDKDVIRMIINAAKRRSNSEDAPHERFGAFFNKTDEYGCTVLELAMKRNYVDVVELILLGDRACPHGHGWKKHGLMNLIYEAIDLEYSEDIVKLLSQAYEAGITTDHTGVLNLILAIKKRDKESVSRLLADAKQLVTFSDDEGWTPLHYAAYHQFVSVLDAIIKAQEDVEYQSAYGNRVSTPLHIAAECGYTSTVVRLMQLWPASSPAYTAVDKNGRNILHLAAAGNKKEMVQGILKYCPEKFKDKILKEQEDVNGDTPLHLLISHGCFIPELIKHKGLDTMVRNKKNWTPRDMLYFEDNIVADQVKIKMALDDVQTNRSWNFWHKRMKKETDIIDSLVLPSERETKDVEFNKKAKSLMDEKRAEMKKDLERYKKRTSTQIVVATLITTVTFTVGFTMPGGLHQSGEIDAGLVVLNKKAAFNACLVSDTLAFLLSTCSLFLYFLESMYDDAYQVSKLNATAVGLNIVSVLAMMLTFITGTYVVLSHSPALTITICIIGSIFFLLVIVLLIKMVYDQQVKRDED